MKSKTIKIPANVATALKLKIVSENIFIVTIKKWILSTIKLIKNQKLLKKKNFNLKKKLSLL